MYLEKLHALRAWENDDFQNETKHKYSLILYFIIYTHFQRHECVNIFIEYYVESKFKSIITILTLFCLNNKTIIFFGVCTIQLAFYCKERTKRRFAEDKFACGRVGQVGFN